MKVVLSGYYGFDNVGDEAILFSLISALREENQDIHITVLSNDPEKTAQQYGVEAVNRWKLKDVAKAIRQSDGLISGGGSLLQDKTGNKSVIYYSGVMWIAKLLGKPFVIYAQGIGPINQLKNQRIVKHTLNRASLITVRDRDSQEFLTSVGLKKESTIVPDPVLGMNKPSLDESPWLASENIPSDYIAVSMRDWSDGREYLEKTAAALDELLKKGEKIVLLPMHGEHDYNTLEQLLSLMEKRDGDIWMAPYDATIQEKVVIVGQAKLLLGMRLHALIFAAVMNVPFHALSYDPKIDSFANLCQQPVVGHVEKDDWSADDIVTKVITADLSEQNDYLLEYTTEATQKAKHTAQQTLDILAK
ncbi:polysaccharide pyruvyl transferase CsaB [Texcoconibacillus texcoconensis]|uniref:Polysaccharide pyruvyl transferase CsaB n=1 Tax=Texcoconibacillus texcoconensis TaxID=1095777 RepID=A0A840QQR1_9BACI|nr:polysaccharide pyruvyl transferase CsaB [Texcoconibacillus texcoconensis]MBB5173782.1 polysaccharide pyruvyl transferase CsaB [Texcoconibacillus texcoconensis]